MQNIVFKQWLHFLGEKKICDPKKRNPTYEKFIPHKA